MLTPDTRVVLVTPDIPRLHGTEATVLSIERWGYHCNAPAAATGRYRAGHNEVAQLLPRFTAFDTSPCPTCSAFKLLRAGACLCCQECGSTTGCG